MEIKSSGLTGHIYKTGASPKWQLRFYHPEKRQRQRVSLGTTDLAVAKAKAKVIIDTTAAKGLEALRGFARRDTTKSIGDAIEHYKKVSKIASRHVNVNSLLRVLRLAYGTKDNEALKRLPLSVLTPKLVSKYIAAYPGSKYSIRSNLVKSRAIFAHPLLWQDFELPDNIKKFAAATTGMPAPVATFVRIDPEILAKMDESSKAIGGATRRAYLLTRYLGMTPKEVAYCRKGWIEERSDRHVIVIIERPEEDLKLKTGYKRGRVMSLPPWMVPELLAVDDYMIDRRTPGLRKAFMDRNFNAWVREFIPDRRSAAYELRRQAGSDMLNATGKISVVQHMLGHADPSTTAKFYAVFDREVDVAAVWHK